MIRRFRSPLAAAVLVGLLAGVISAFFMVSSASEADGWPVEQAEVIAIEDPGAVDALRDGCGRNGGPGRDITLRSADPPPGLDETFVIEDECHSDDIAIGEVWPVARVVDGDGDVEAYTFPTSVAETWRQSLLAAGVAFAATLVLLPVWTWARRRYGRADHQRY